LLKRNHVKQVFEPVNSDPIVSNVAWDFLAQTQSRQTGIRACQLGPDYVKLRLGLPCSDAITSDFLWNFVAQGKVLSAEGARYESQGQVRSEAEHVAPGPVIPSDLKPWKGEIKHFI